MKIFTLFALGVFVLIQSGGFGLLNFWRTATAVIMKFCTLVEKLMWKILLYVIYVTRLHLYFFCCSLDYITRLLIYRYSIVSGGCLIHFRLCCLHRVIIHAETNLWIVEILMISSLFLRKESDMFEDQQNLPKPLFTKILVVIKVVMKILLLPKWNYFNTFQHISQVSSKKIFQCSLRL